MKLSQRDREVLSAAQMHADGPLTRVRKLTNYREHSVRYSLQRALDEKIIVKRCFINLNRLGFNQYEMYFTMATDNRNARTALLKSLVNMECVSWLGHLGGDFQYGMNIAARSLSEVMELFADLSDKFGSLFLQKAFAERISFTYFGNKYLAPKLRSPEPMKYEASSEKFVRDSVDHEILSAAVRLGEGSSRLLARELSIPQTTVDYRMRRLKKGGVIVGFYFELQPEELGMQSYMLLLSMKTMSLKTNREIEAFCSSHPNIVILVHSMGSWDFCAGIDAESAMQVTEIVEAIYDRFGSQINSVKALPAFRNLKVAEYPFRKFNPGTGTR